MNTSDPRSAQEQDSEEEPTQVGAGIDFSDPNSPLAPYYLRSSHLVAVGFLGLVFLFFGVFTPLAHTDIWGHLKYGEWIVTHRALPDRELFSSFSDPGEPYWNFQWLSQAIFYLVYAAGVSLAGGDEIHQMAGGVEMLRSLHGLLITLKVAFIMLAIRRATKSLPLAIAGAALLVAFTMGPSRVQRPQVFAEVFFAMLIWWASAPRLSRASWLAVPLLFALWANCHGSFAIGFLFLGLIWLGQVLEYVRPRPRSNAAVVTAKSWLWQGGAAIALSLLAIGMLNPHGFQIYPGVMKLAQHPNIRTIAEWAPLDFGQRFGGHWTFLATALLVLLSQLASPRPMALPHLLVLFPFALGTLYQQRLSNWWLMLVPWLVAPLWADAAALLPRFWLRCRSVPSFRKTLLAALFILIGFSWSGFFYMLIGNDPLPLQSSVTNATLWEMAMEIENGGRMPKLAEAFQAYPQQRFAGRLFVQDSLADFPLWYVSEKTPLLIYNHAHLFPAAIWQDQIFVLSARPGWASILERYQVNLIAMDPVAWPELAAKLREDPAWIIVVDEGATVSEPEPVSVANMKVMIAVRKTPL